VKRGLIISEQDKRHINGLYGLISEEEQMISQVKQELNGVLSQAGIELSDEEVKETLQDCPIEEPANSEESEYVNQIISKLDGMNLSQLVKELKNLLKLKDEPIKEQIGATIIIGGVSVPTLIAFGVAAILVMAIIGMIARLIGGRRRTYGKRRCGRRRTLFQRIAGLFKRRR
tara:strand:- start:387 stop:905 length:519 start_codon:yes stop_codon:yes gene_type:complete